ncbi:hypothetical protein M8818_001967 [Zalaria obscura]|uniref:Uncharacterized protein n=1 Tax=Zalaria obscura TaxID=2024903 RepID=A0ACC3SN56_9PEZI
MLASGFTNATVSRNLIIFIVVSSILASITDTKYYFWIAVKPHLRDYRQLWRLLTWQLCYTNSTEVLFAAMTLYQCRVVERAWGGRKFASFLISTLPYTTLLPPLLLALLIRPLSLNTINLLPAGPTALIFALLAQYHAAIPYTYKYQLSSPTPTSTPTNQGLELTSKSTTYLLPAQLALAQFPGSAIAAAVGWCVGYAWRREVLPGASGWRIPDWRGGRKERYEGLRRRMEGEAGRATGVEREGGGGGAGRRRTIGGQILDQFRGAF